MPPSARNVSRDADAGAFLQRRDHLAQRSGPAFPQLALRTASGAADQPEAEPGDGDGIDLAIAVAGDQDAGTHDPRGA